MRNNQPVTTNQYLLSTDARLISGTDRQGRITYCNDQFVEVSGFERDELIGSPHNLVRHPDMPSAVFKDMWSYISKGKVWMGLVKNRRKNGDYYWVSAFVTPVFENDKVVGYESVRVNALPDEIARAEATYKRIRSGLSPRPQLARYQHQLFKLLPVWLPGVVASVVIGSTWGGGPPLLR